MKAIYEPSGRAREYSPLAVNFYTGCNHGCLYCYAPAVLRMQRSDYTLAVAPRVGILEALRKELPSWSGASEQLLMNFIGDPYCAAEEEHRVTRQALELCLRHHLPVAILTKGGNRCLQDHELFWAFGMHIKVGMSLTFLEAEQSTKWEPGAAAPLDRIQTLYALHTTHVPTWASMEPVIDPRQSLELIGATLVDVDEYRLGKLNHDHELEISIDWPAYLEKALTILRKAGKKIYVKADLRQSCPEVELRPQEIEMDRYNAIPWGRV